MFLLFKTVIYSMKYLLDSDISTVKIADLLSRTLNKSAISRSSRSQIFFKIGILKISQYSQESTCVGSLYNKVAGVKACNFIKKKLQHRCFPVSIAKFLRTVFVYNASGGCLSNSLNQYQRCRYCRPNS